MRINGAAMKAKGSAFEREVVRALKRLGFPYAERAYGAGRPHDVGDIGGVPGLVFECKARRAIELAAWVDEAQREAANAGAVGVVVAKRRGRPAEDAYVVLSLSDFAALMAGRHQGDAGERASRSRRKPQGERHLRVRGIRRGAPDAGPGGG
jgi:Holliday junction resolvase